MKRCQLCGGVTMACFAAGPVFLIGWIVPALIVELAAPTHMLKDIFLALMAIPVAALIGAPISLIRNVTGGIVMASLGVRYPTTRARRVWAIVVAVLAIGFAVPFIGLEQEVLPAHALCAFTGAVCALLVRYGTRWNDDSA